MKLSPLAILAGFGALAWYAYTQKKRADDASEAADAIRDYAIEQDAMIEAQEHAIVRAWAREAALREVMGLEEGEYVVFHSPDGFGTDDEDLEATED